MPPTQQNKALLAARKKVLLQAAIVIQVIIITVVLVVGMSAAWYTNVVQTSGLQFQAKSWGFTGEATIVAQPIVAAPGDSGTVGLTVTNSGDQVTEVAVRVTKEQMDEPMRQRLFFYADTTASRNGEVVPRVYINAVESYTYSLLGQGQLVLTDERANDVPVAWHWVYDMLGYYFLGTVTAEDGGQTVSPQVQEYLRPVEYELDRATFEDGRLKTVDGVTTVAQFLAQLSAADGYPTPITATEYPGYYQVGVNDSGYGVWLYLCNWTEIQQAMLYDSQVGEAAAQAAENNTAADLFRATLTVVGQQAEETFTEITTAGALADGLNNGGLLRLEQDVVLVDKIAVDSGSKSVIDLNGHTLVGPAGSPLMLLSQASDVTVVNGSITAQDAQHDVIVVDGSNLTLNQVHLSGQGDDAIDITNQAGVNACVRIVDSHIEMGGCAVYLRGNGALSEGKTRVVIEHSTLKGDYIGVMGSGNRTAFGTDVLIYQSTVTGRYAAVYHPQGDSVMRVTDSTLNGDVGAVIKGGELHIVNSTLMAEGPFEEPAYNGSGFSQTGDALYVDGSYGYPMQVTVSGNCRFTSAHGRAIRVFEEDIDFASVTVTGGTFSSDVSAFVPDGYAYDPATGTVSAVA